LRLPFQCSPYCASGKLIECQCLRRALKLLVSSKAMCTSCGIVDLASRRQGTPRDMFVHLVFWGRVLVAGCVYILQGMLLIVELVLERCMLLFDLAAPLYQDSRVKLF
jgi:hypothetical protein